jgi:hypothetical protein
MERYWLVGAATCALPHSTSVFYGMEGQRHWSFYKEARSGPRVVHPGIRYSVMNNNLLFIDFMSHLLTHECACVV